MTPENCTLDELIEWGLHSPYPVLQELCKRLTGHGACTTEALAAPHAIGRTIRAIEERGDTVLLKFTDGGYFVIDGDVDCGEVEFTMGRKLLRSELYRYNLMSPAEAQIYRDEQAAQAAEQKAARLEKLRKELAELEGGGK